MDKSPDAFRTISEAADELDLPQHVLRFWETRFPQIKPLKRGGGRRYYRPDDVHLLKGIRHLLYDQGFTIKGVQRILKDQGTKHVAAIGETGTIRPIAAARPHEAAEPEFDAPVPDADAAPMPRGRVEPSLDGEPSPSVYAQPQDRAAAPSAPALNDTQRQNLQAVLDTLEQCRAALDKARGI